MKASEYNHLSSLLVVRDLSRKTSLPQNFLIAAMSEESQLYSQRTTNNPTFDIQFTIIYSDH